MYNVSVYIDPGNVVLSTDPQRLSTVVGSGVAICLRDRRLRYGAMGHYMYPTVRDKNYATTWYGNVTIITMIRMMDEMGCSRDELEAQILGGAHLRDEDEFDNIGTDNVDVARRGLDHYGVVVISEDTGGVVGRKIIFDVHSGHVAILKVHEIRETDWHRKD